MQCEPRDHGEAISEVTAGRARGACDAAGVHGVTLAGRVRRRDFSAKASTSAVPTGRIEALDAELARHSRGAGRLRLEMGRGLDRVARSHGHHEMGFSSIEAYSLERCERTASWTQKTRALAARLEELPGIRQSLISGSITWSMASLLATVAEPEDEATWLADARGRTLRQMRATLAEEGHGGKASAPGATDADEEEEGSEADPEPIRTLSLTVPREDAWLFESARILARHLGEATLGDALFAMVAEATTTLYASVPRDAVALDEDDSAEQKQSAWEEQLQLMREHAEELCEARHRQAWARGHGGSVPQPGPQRAEPIAWPPSAHGVDALLRGLAGELAEREVTYGRALEAFFRADGWRRLGYATARQYASERLGASLSSIKDRRQLARRLRSLPQVAGALERREVGYEAARLVARVATPETAGDWVARARERTIRHLREEIEAAELVTRWSNGGPAAPPSEDTSRAFAELERRVITGQMSAARMAELERAVSAGQISTTGTITLRLPVPRSTAREYRRVEALFRRHAPVEATFLRFACQVFHEQWHLRPGDVPYSHIYARDRFRCQSPVCGRHDVTPHHLRFRSAGGDDADDNVTTLCAWCHLEGIHGGRLDAEPPANAIRWTLGRHAHTVVEGRRRLRAA